jgi:putative ATP-dependent endonuclease of OLD family
LRKTETIVSDFTCAIGENNAGKSSLLQALLLFVKGTKLSKSEYYNPDKDILISVDLDGVTDGVLSQITDDHKTKIEKYVIGEELKLARRYSKDGSSKLRVVTNVAKDAKFHTENVDDLFKGTKGAAITEKLTTFYPEVLSANPDANATTQIAAKELIADYCEALPETELMEKDIPLPTGIDNSIITILPEPIYIPAVKDLSDELKTKETASFGKLLNILLNVIENDLADAAETFEHLRAKLNRIAKEDGTIVDDRMDKVKEIENTIQRNLQETFRNVEIELEIPPPHIKTVLSNANIVADDGVRGPIENKGDGFKRAITFSILRSYVQLSQSDEWQKQDTKKKSGKDKFLFLFEEPELYLHPSAQNILFDALSLISKKHQVVVTTHSPLFFSSDDTTTFVKVSKRNYNDLDKPVGECMPVDLTDIREKDKFQIISFESSNLAFFSKKIVLVEGDSELIVFPHIAKLLNKKWDFNTSSVSIVKINGKGSFKRYKDFFERFAVKVYLVSDLDIIIRDFDKIEPSKNAMRLRSELIQIADKIIDKENKLTTPAPKLIKKELQQQRTQEIVQRIIDARSTKNLEEQSKAIEDFFQLERTEPRLEVLKDHTQQAVLEKKRELLSVLRSGGVFVLEKGAIEAYYPDTVVGGDKPTKAQSFCTIINTGDDVTAICEYIECDDELTPEFNAIFSGIFV